jgi:hypothetical protein
VALLLLYGQLGGWNSLESPVRDGLAALDRESVGAGCEPRLGALQRGKVLVEIVRTTGIELVLVKVFGTLVAWLLSIRSLERTVTLERGKRLFDACAFACQQVSGALRVHTRRLPGGRTPAPCGQRVVPVVMYNGLTAVLRARRFSRARKPPTPAAARRDETALMTMIVVMIRLLS